MPHITLEHSSNIIEKNALFEVLKQINFFLSEVLPIELAYCKGRAIESQTSCIGAGNPNDAYIHVILKVMTGRSFEKLNVIGSGIMDMLKQFFHNSDKQLNLQITLEIDEIQNPYFRNLA